MIKVLSMFQVLQNDWRYLLCMEIKNSNYNCYHGLQPTLHNFTDCNNLGFVRYDNQFWKRNFAWTLVALVLARDQVPRDIRWRLYQFQVSWEICWQGLVWNKVLHHFHQCFPLWGIQGNVPCLCVNCRMCLNWKCLRGVFMTAFRICENLRF